MMTSKKVGAVLSAACLLGGSLPAWAQRRRAEPEANPQFQQELQGASDAGEPVSGQPQGREEEPSSPAATPGARGVQIGAAPAAPAAPPAPVAPLETRVTVRVKEAPLATFLDTISAQAKINFIITEGLETKRVTAFLQNVTVREALQILLEIKGLTYQQIGRSNTYVVSPRSKAAPNRITRIYILSYISLIPLREVDSAAPGTLSSDPGSQQGPQQEKAGGGGGGGQRRGDRADRGSRDGSIGILNIVRSVLSQLGEVEIDPRTNSLIVTDIPEVFPQVEQIIAELDKKAPQVIIEAQIVEINADRTQDLGIEWGGPNGELLSYTGGLRETLFPLDLPKNVSKARIFPPVSPQNVISSLGGSSSKDTAGDAASLPSGNDISLVGVQLKTAILDLSQLRVLLKALITRAEARFLGKPKVLTLNNKTAVIQITQDQAVSKKSTQQAAEGLAQQVTTVERRVTGLQLKVTPQINKEGYITLSVEPRFTNVRESELSSTSDPVFDTITRMASTLVRVKNGQTLVLGGLLSSRESKVVRKVPLLGYIPLIGWLFTSVSSQRNNTDLVLFITPTVVND